METMSAGGMGAVVRWGKAMTNQLLLLKVGLT
jgi:hypothetical protein